MKGKEKSATVSLRKARIQGHAVPKDLQKARGSATTFMQPEGAQYLTHAEKTKSLLSVVHNGLLSTNHHKLNYPYGSIINFVLDSDGKPYTFISRLAEHTANLLNDPRASVLVSQVQGLGDKLATARVTLVGRMLPIEKTEELVKKFIQVHPGAYYAEFDDFMTFKLDVENIRYIGGFGEMSWVPSSDYIHSEIDPVSGGIAAKNAIDHMNKDHKDDVLSMARAYAGLPEATEATILGLDRYGLDVLCILPDGKRRSRVTFEKRLESSDEIKQTIIDLTRKARMRRSSL
uniref:DUF2470 domain-containing protein n=1 Tax=Aplanochytrium stocchinoi TaxID=215587 RepID=A0A7S3LN26_9STRA|mmetsp:Transcript_33034/g.40549  ORF Transcript_33034/g.40549 Transcript_33034/m.40549 type:complete len:289 (-) Transcript_33034:337-1203(-)|eukprot:CAMPEP_0204837212 /NCGR_PEP_ID=MMETSP1346-20131115/27295_1 /ASSEMBLY_ACC=CAM_ASM_000771 /TAXON_ID=215587 /ORGANISM="Aplanochytrium stocchinoi, Strain GSBS06" /LENGTH=288 /DNA_ID=CAMNT_0051972513 /DNA_START=120 /DNA_END=986 /DNA_ORIENTATION=-